MLHIPLFLSLSYLGRHFTVVVVGLKQVSLEKSSSRCQIQKQHTSQHQHQYNEQ